MVAEMADYASSVRMRNVLKHSDGCRDGGICVSSSFVKISDMLDSAFWHSDGCRDDELCVFSAARQCSLTS